MNNAYESLMKAAQPRQSQARPAHHIIEEKTNPITGKKQLSGSSWKEDTLGLQQDFDRRAADPGVGHKARDHYYNLANQLEVDIAQEDAYHKAHEEESQLQTGDREFYKAQGARARVQQGLPSESGVGMGIPKREAERRGYIPPR